MHFVQIHIRGCGLLAVACAVLALLGVGLLNGLAEAKKPVQGLFPDLQTVVPKHLQVKKVGGEDVLRFTNGIANRGAGHLQLRPDPCPDQAPPDTEVTNAIQEILLVNPTEPPACTTPDVTNITHSAVVSTFEFHPEHNHWHVADFALFEVRYARDNGMGGRWGKVVGEASEKTTFCIIDWYKLDDNANTAERAYFDCAVDYQGIQTGWVDQYHHALPDQDLVITGASEGIYYLVSTVNFDANFIEENYTNNTAWVSFELTYTQGGKPQIADIAHSRCDTPGMCGEQALNR